MERTECRKLFVRWHKRAALRSTLDVRFGSETPIARSSELSMVNQNWRVERKSLRIRALPVFNHSAMGMSFRFKMAARRQNYRTASVGNGLIVWRFHLQFSDEFDQSSEARRYMPATGIVEAEARE